ncbi:MAG TPA: Gfo/Idh/MocA family oxidoreductase [Streptosporangiaceae bacterium]|nr:Gfo/Idh/MocA family oxidoreductase [Streptosporangiaceae bacterium]
MTDSGTPGSAAAVSGADGAGPGGSRKFGIGIVGAGVISATHAEAIAALPNARITAVTDVEPGRAQAFAAEHDAAPEADLAALLARDDVDVVSVCVPSGRHAEIGVQAAAAGKHLIVEKPVDVTLAAADQLITAADAAGVALTVISQHRFDPGLIRLRELAGSGGLGRLLLGEASTKWFRSQGYYDSAAWRGTWAMDGGSLLNQGIHYVDMLTWIMGPVAEVSAVYATGNHQIEVEDTALAVVRFASGAVGTITSSTVVFPGFAQRLEISGTNGTAIIEDGEIAHLGLREESPGPGLRGSREQLGATLPGAAVSAAAIGVASHAAQIADLLGAVEQSRPPAVTGADGRAALEIICAVYESARTGHPVTIAARPAAAPTR